MAEDVGDGSPGTSIGNPPSFVLDMDSETAIARQIEKYPPGRQASAVLPVLYIAQEQMRRHSGIAWLPRTALDAVAVRLGMPAIRVYEVATFYTMFNARPIGRYHLQVCTTTPCWLRGSDDVMAACREATGIAASGETSADGMFTITEVECLGACVNAPMLQVDDDSYEDLDGPRTRALIEALRRGERPPPGSVIGRQTSAPEGGPTTLITLHDLGPPALPTITAAE